MAMAALRMPRFSLSFAVTGTVPRRCAREPAESASVAKSESFLSMKYGLRTLLDAIAGCCRYLTKPVKVNEMTRVSEEVFVRKR
jgi:hypothetical protein